VVQQSHGDTCMFITTFTSASRLSVTRTRCIQSVPPHPTSWRSILLLSSLCQIFQVVSFAPVSQTKDCTHISCLPYMPHAPPITFLIWLREYLLRCTDHESYSKIYIKILPIVIKCVCVIIQVFFDMVFNFSVSVMHF